MTEICSLKFGDLKILTFPGKYLQRLLPLSSKCGNGTKQHDLINLHIIHNMFCHQTFEVRQAVMWYLALKVRSFLHNNWNVNYEVWVKVHSVVLKDSASLCCCAYMCIFCASWEALRNSGFLRTVPTNNTTRVFLQGFTMREKQTIASTVRIQKENWG